MADGPLSITVPFDVGRTSPNRRMHWAVRAREVKRARLFAESAWRAAGSPTMTEPVDVSLLVRRGRRMDLDNLLASCKGALDGLFNEAITPDDSETWVRSLRVAQETGRQWKGAEQLVVTITPVETR